jgi:hypothetical protein
MNFNPWLSLLNIQQASVDYWKMFGVDYSYMLDEVWIYPLWKWYFDQYTVKDGCLENYQYVYGC